MDHQRLVDQPEAYHQGFISRSYKYDNLLPSFQEPCGILYLLIGNRDLFLTKDTAYEQNNNY